MVKKYKDSSLLYFFEIFLKRGVITHFVSSRYGGFSKPPYDSLNLAFHVGDSPGVVVKNRRHLASILEIPLDYFTTAQQIHSSNVKIINEALRGCGASDYETAIKATDAMVTNLANICLLLLFADCVPILFFSPKNKVIGIAHAGWRGTVLLIAQNVIKVFQEEFSCLPADIIVGIGPSIGPCCYEVSRRVILEVEKVFKNKHAYIIDRVINRVQDGRAYLDLWEANRLQLLEVGVEDKNIEIARICTYCKHDLFFSQRYHRVKTGRFGVGIMIN